MKTRLTSPRPCSRPPWPPRDAPSSPSDYTIERQAVHGLPTVTATDTTTAKVTVEAIDYDSLVHRPDRLRRQTRILPRRTLRPQRFNQDQGRATPCRSHYDTPPPHLHPSQANETPNAQLTEVMANRRTRTKARLPGPLPPRRESQATVLSIDYTTRVVSMRMPPGDILTLTASEKLPDFDKVKVGDTVIFRLHPESLTVDASFNRTPLSETATKKPSSFPNDRGLLTFTQIAPPLTAAMPQSATASANAPETPAQNSPPHSSTPLPSAPRSPATPPYSNPSGSPPAQSPSRSRSPTLPRA